MNSCGIMMNNKPGKCLYCLDCKSEGFQKIAETDTGLVIFKHTPSAPNIRGESATPIDKEVFILQNTKNSDVSSADFLPELDQKKITCPRCRAMMSRAQKLFENITTIHKRGVLGICKHCRIKAQIRSICDSCNEVVQKFLFDERQQKKLGKSKLHVRSWLKAHHRLEDDEKELKTKDERAVIGVESKFLKERSKIGLKPSDKPIPEEGPYEFDDKIIKSDTRELGADRTKLRDGISLEEIMLRVKMKTGSSETSKVAEKDRTRDIQSSKIHSLSDLSILQLPDVKRLLQARPDDKLLDSEGINVGTTLPLETLPDKAKPKRADSKDLSVKIQRVEYVHAKLESTMSDESLEYLKSFLDRNKQMPSEKKPRPSSLKSALGKAIPKQKKEASLESFAGDLIRPESIFSDDLSRVVADHIVKDNVYYFPPKQKKDIKRFPAGTKRSSELIKDVHDKLQTQAEEIKKKERDELKIKERQKIQKLLEQSKILTMEGKPLSIEEFDTILKEIEKKEGKKLSSNEIARLIKRMHTSDGRLLHPNEIAKIAKDILAEEVIIPTDEIEKLIRHIQTKNGKLLPPKEIEKFLKQIRTMDGTFLDPEEVEKLVRLIQKNDGKLLLFDDIENFIKQVHVKAEKVFPTDEIDKLLKQIHTEDGKLLPSEEIEKLTKHLKTKDGKHLTPEEVEELVKQIQMRDGKPILPNDLEKIIHQMRQDEKILPPGEIENLLTKIQTKDGKLVPSEEIEKMVRQLRTKDGKPLLPEQVTEFVKQIRYIDGKPVTPSDLEKIIQQIISKGSPKVLPASEIDKLLKHINTKDGKKIPPEEMEKLIKQLRTKDGKSLSPEEVQLLVRKIQSKEGKVLTPEDIEKYVKQIQIKDEKALSPGEIDKLLKHVNTKDGKQLPLEEIEKLVKQMRTKDGKPLSSEEVQQLVKKIQSKDGKPISPDELETIIKHIQSTNEKSLPPGEIDKLLKQVNTKDGKKLPPEEIEKLVKQMRTKDGKPLSPEEVQQLVKKIQSKDGNPISPDELETIVKQIQTKDEKALPPGENDRFLKQLNTKDGKQLSPDEIEKLVGQMRTKDGKPLSPEKVQQLVIKIQSKDGKPISPDELETILKQVQTKDEYLKEGKPKDGKHLSASEADKFLKQINTQDGKPMPISDIEKFVRQMRTKNGQPLSEEEVQKFVKQIQANEGKRLTPQELENMLQKIRPESEKSLPPAASQKLKEVHEPKHEDNVHKTFGMPTSTKTAKEPATLMDKSVDTNEPKRKMENAATTIAELQTKDAKPEQGKKGSDEVHKEDDSKTRDKKGADATNLLNKALAAQMKDKEKEEKLKKAQEEEKQKAILAATAATALGKPATGSKDAKDDTRKGKEEKELKSDDAKDVSAGKTKKELDGTNLLNKALSAQAKEQEKQLKMKKQMEESLNKAKNAAAAATNKELPSVGAKLQPKKAADGKESSPFRPELTQSLKPPPKDLNLKDVVMSKPSDDDLILSLVRTKQTKEPPRPTEITPIKYRIQKSGYSVKSSRDLVRDAASLQFDLESLERNKNAVKEYGDIVVGTKVLKDKPGVYEEELEKNAIPALFQSTFIGEPLSKKVKHEEIVDVSPPEKGKHTAEGEPAKGVIRYSLSDRSFIEKGWTLLPTEKVVRKMNVYRMRPAHPEFDWFEHNKKKRLMTYDTGEKLAEFDDDGRGRWYYRNGRLALNYYDSQETNAQQRFVIFSNGEPDERGRRRPITVLGTFDYLGNGVVFDHSGKIRLKYNQTEGVILDRSLGPVSHWKWHSLNDPPVLQQVMIDTQLSHKDPEILKLGTSHDDVTRPDNEEMLAIEFDNFIKEKSKKLSQKFKPFQIKMKAMKLNEHFSLRVLDQATIYLIYRDGTTNLKLNLGMLLDHQEIVDTDTAEMGEVSSNLERLPARTDSIEALQKNVSQAQRIEKLRIDRDRRLRPVIPIASVDRMAASTSKPLRPVFTRTSASMTSPCKCRKPPSNNIYYDTRLV